MPLAVSVAPSTAPRRRPRLAVTQDVLACVKRQRQIDAMVIEALAQDEQLTTKRLGLLTKRLSEVEKDRDIFREVAREAIHLLHAQHLRITQLEKRLNEINAERRADRTAA
jgi:alkylhydroperoxidase family enzyme